MGGLRRKLYENLEPEAWPGKGLSSLNATIITLILFSVVFTIIESEQGALGISLEATRAVEIALAVVFGVEYILRVWVSAETPKYGPGVVGRLRYMLSPTALLDLIALSPVLFLGAGGEVFLLRLLRLLRILRLARLGRFSMAMAAIGEAVKARGYELIMSMVFAGALLLISSTLLYVVEGESQPEAFGSIPRAMWWSIATLTTVGYGDVTPVTVIGRILAGLTAISGIGLIALPTGILAAAFSEALQKRREELSRDAD
ncbi:MAG: potassium channel family protein [Maricaulaceae bacterium]|nr:potassium channel family protein [Maricaulaceae bacterium]